MKKITKQQVSLMNKELERHNANFRYYLGVDGLVRKKSIVEARKLTAEEQKALSDLKAKIR